MLLLFIFLTFAFVVEIRVEAALPCNQGSYINATIDEPKATCGDPCGGSKKGYVIGTRPVNWYQANILCRQSGMKLASITTEAEESTLENLLDKYPTKNGVGKGYWTSGYRYESCGDYFVWFDQAKPIIYENFAPGQPDNAGGKETCVEIFMQIDKSYLWNDLNCENYKIGYVCEYCCSCN